MLIFRVKIDLEGVVTFQYFYWQHPVLL